MNKVWIPANASNASLIILKINPKQQHFRPANSFPENKTSEHTEWRRTSFRPQIHRAPTRNQQSGKKDTKKNWSWEWTRPEVVPYTHICVDVCIMYTGMCVYTNLAIQNQNQIDFEWWSASARPWLQHPTHERRRTFNVQSELTSRFVGFCESKKTNQRCNWISDYVQKKMPNASFRVRKRGGGIVSTKWDLLSTIEATSQKKDDEWQPLTEKHIYHIEYH